MPDLIRHPYGAVKPNTADQEAATSLLLDRGSLDAGVWIPARGRDDNACPAGMRKCLLARSFVIEAQRSQSVIPTSPRK
jgi:hypothetical protein